MCVVSPLNLHPHAAWMPACPCVLLLMLPVPLQVRLLCRRQFLARALGLKVAQAQRQQQQQQRVSGGSSSQQQQQQQQQSNPYTMTHGDTWTHR